MEFSLNGRPSRDYIQFRVKFGFRKNQIGRGNIWENTWETVNEFKIKTLNLVIMFSL